MVDVVAQLEQRAAANPQKLNWRTSIVDLLKLLDIDSSFAARKELATELACPPELMSDSAKMNTWLHKTVLARSLPTAAMFPKNSSTEPPLNRTARTVRQRVAGGDRRRGADPGDFGGSKKQA